MTLSRLEEKYGAKAKPVRALVAPKTLTHWRDSASVVALSEFLKGTEGLSIGMRGNEIVLRFEAPACHPDKSEQASDRWADAVAAERLFHAALEDLYRLVAAGLLSLPRFGGSFPDPLS